MTSKKTGEREVVIILLPRKGGRPLVGAKEKTKSPESTCNCLWGKPAPSIWRGRGGGF